MPPGAKPGPSGDRQPPQNTGTADKLLWSFRDWALEELSFQNCSLLSTVPLDPYLEEASGPRLLIRTREGVKTGLCLLPSGEQS